MASGYKYRASARWTTRRRGVVEPEAARPAIDFTAPPEFQGEAGLWTPEHFLVGAAATCFITTFRAIAEISKFEFEGLEVTAEGSVEKTPEGFQFTRLLLRPVLTIENENARERGLRLLEKAERSCLVSRSLKSEIRMEATVEVGAEALKS